MTDSARKCSDRDPPASVDSTCLKKRSGQTYVFRIDRPNDFVLPRVIEVLDNVADLDFTPDQ